MSTPIELISFTLPDLKELAETLEKHFFHPEIINDVLKDDTWDKITSYDGQTLMILHFLDRNKHTGVVQNNKIFFFLNETTLIVSAQYPDSSLENYISHFRKREKAESPVLHQSAYFVLYEILNLLYYKSMMHAENIHKTLEEQRTIIRTHNTFNMESLKELVFTRDELLLAKSNLIPHRELLIELWKLAKEDESLARSYQNLQYEQNSIVRQINLLTEYANSLIENFNLLASQQTNDSVRFLTSITIGLGIMAFLSGAYGMNVTVPGQSIPGMFYIVAPLIIALGLFAIFITNKLTK